MPNTNNTQSSSIIPQPDLNHNWDFRNSIIRKKDNTEYEIIIYQMGKVGSTSIVESLNMLPTIEAYQSHFLGAENLHSVLNLALNLDLHPHFLKHQKGQIMMNIDLTRLVKSHIDGRANNPKLGIVSITRDPIDWFRSQIIQDISAYLDGFAILAGLEDKQQLSAETIMVAMGKIREKFKEIIRTIGGLINLEFSGNLQKLYEQELIGRDPHAEIFITHFKHFLRPFLWYPKMITSVFDIMPEELQLNNEGYQLIKRNWGFFYLFRYEELELGFNRVVKQIGYDNVQLSRSNVSIDKRFSNEINLAFVKWENDKVLKKLIQSDYTQKFGYD